MELAQGGRDGWCVQMANKAATAIENHPSVIVCEADITAIRDLPGSHNGTGKKTVAKIVELLRTRKLARLEALMSSPRVQCLLSFNKIWGVGMKTAQDLYTAGFRSIDDVRARGTGMLNERQAIGVKYYDEFLERVPRYGSRRCRGHRVRVVFARVCVVAVAVYQSTHVCC